MCGYELRDGDERTDVKTLVLLFSFFGQSILASVVLASLQYALPSPSYRLRLP